MATQESAGVICNILKNSKTPFEMIIVGIFAIIWFFVLCLCIVIALTAYFTMVYKKEEDKKRYDKGRKIIKYSLAIGFLPLVVLLSILIIGEMGFLILTGSC